MKRHQSLTPLSREHHEALILARLLQKNAPAFKGLPIKTADKALYAVSIYNDSLQGHFIKEEKLLDKVKKYHADIHRMAGEIMEEHKTLTTAFMKLKKKENLPEALDDLGLALEKHIRKEERILFPLIEQYCPEEILKAIVL